MGCSRNGIVTLFVILFVFGCGDDLEFGNNRREGLRLGKDGQASLQFGVRSNRPVEDTTVHGTVFNIRPATSRPIVVFVFVDLRDPGTFQDFRDAEVALVKDDRTFTVTHLAAGDLTIIFLLDQVGVNQDGTIDPGDPIATFQDPAARLKHLSAATTVLLEDVDLSFNFNVPEMGTATVQTEANILVTQGIAETQ